MSIVRVILGELRPRHRMQRAALDRRLDAYAADGEPSSRGKK